MIERFSIQEFEAVLPNHKIFHKPLWYYVGLKDGERTYHVVVNQKVEIEIRSSIDKSGFAADTGENSIRCWLVDLEGKPLGSKVNKWTTREVGWNDRLLKQLRILWGWVIEAGECSNCHQPKGIFKSKSKDNPGRIFAKCTHCNDGFKWIS